MRFYLRAILLTVFRFLLLTILYIFNENFEVSPLPGWTLGMFAYAMHFFVTYGCAHWAFRKRVPTAYDIAYVSALFIILNSAFEGWVYLFLTRGTVQDLLRNYNLTSAFLIMLYATAIFLAAYDVRRKRVRSELAEGLES